MIDFDYKNALDKKDPKKVFEVFNKQLRKFCDEYSRLKCECILFPLFNDKDGRRKNLQKMGEMWTDFVNSTPFPLYPKYIGKGPTENFTMRSIVNKKTPFTGDFQELNEYVNAIIKCCVYILWKKKLLYPEYAVWMSLKYLNDAIDISQTDISPTTISNKVYMLIEEVKKSGMEKPHSTYYMGKLYEEELSSSRKTAIYRGNILKGWVRDFIYTYHEKKKIYPTRKEIEEYLVLQCRNSNEPRLKLFCDGFNPKTLQKLLSGFENKIRRGNANPVVKDEVVTEGTTQLVESNSTRKMNLAEVYNWLKEINPQIKLV